MSLILCQETMYLKLITDPRGDRAERAPGFAPVSARRAAA